MLGKFNDDDQPFIEIILEGVTQQKLSALIDSGYNGYLSVPMQQAFPCGLILQGVSSSKLADGTVVNSLVCLGKVTIDDKKKVVPIDVSNDGPVLLGTKLLKALGKKFVLDCAKGVVEIID